MISRSAVLASAPLVVPVLTAHAAGLSASGDVGLWVTRAGWTLAGLAAFTGALVAAVRLRRGRVGWAWRLWAAAAGSWLAGTVVRDVLAARGSAPDFSAADVLWLLFPVLAIAGLALRAPPGALAFRLFLLDALPVVFLATAGVWVTTGHTQEHAEHGVLVFGYPALYALLALIAAQFLVTAGVGGWLVTLAFWLVAVAALAWPAEVIGGGEAAGHWSAPLWTLGMLALALAGWRRALNPTAYKRLVAARRESGVRALPPTVALLGLILMVVLVGEEFHHVLYGLVFASAVSLAARFYLVRRESSRLLVSLVRSREALAESERRFGAVFRSAAVGIGLTDTRGRLLETNRALQEMLGYSGDELRGMSVQEITHPEDREDGAELLRELLEGARESYEAEKRYLRKDGGAVWGRVSASLTRTGEGVPEFAVGLIENIEERKRAERALRETSQALEALVQSSPLPIVTFDGEGRVTRWNPAAEQVFGWRAEEVLGCPNPLLPEGEEETFRRAVELVLRGKSWRNVEAVRKRKDGSAIDVAISSAPLRDARGEPVGMVAMLADITERKRAEEARARLAAVVESSADGILSLSLDGTVMTWNAGAERIYGYSAAEMVGRSISLVVPPGRENELALLERVRSGEAVQGYETVRLRKDGGEIAVSLSLSPITDASGAVGGISSIVRDISERRQEEERRRAAETKYRTLVEELPLVTYVDALDEISSNIYTSPQIEPLLGYSPEEWQSDPELFVKLLHPEDRERVLGEVGRINATGERYVSEYRLVARDGHVVWFRDAAVVLDDGSGQPSTTQGYLMDITEEKRTEEEREQLFQTLERQNERLLELDRMKDEFVALVSHELRTPLTSILGYLELVLEGDAGEVTEEQRQFLSVVERNSQRLLRLVGDLLLIAQIEAGKLTLERGPVDLAMLARDCIEAARPRADEKGVALVLEAGPVPALSGDCVRLAQVLDNLVSNAIKFTAGGGKVTVGLAQQNGHVLLAVSDTGIGIPAAEQGRLFERFFRTSGATQRAIQGTGLGLAITKAIAEAHGGEISVVSEENVGTTVRITLPPASSVGPAAKPAAAG
ncbi:MAG: PAS domain S-box protein [Gemmatimonadota bacterium]